MLDASQILRDEEASIRLAQELSGDAEMAFPEEDAASVRLALELSHDGGSHSGTGGGGGGGGGGYGGDGGGSGGGDGDGPAGDDLCFHLDDGSSMTAFVLGEYLRDFCADVGTDGATEAVLPAFLRSLGFPDAALAHPRARELFERARFEKADAELAAGLGDAAFEDQSGHAGYDGGGYGGGYGGGCNGGFDGGFDGGYDGGAAASVFRLASFTCCACRVEVSDPGRNRGGLLRGCHHAACAGCVMDMAAKAPPACPCGEPLQVFRNDPPNTSSPRLRPQNIPPAALGNQSPTPPEP